MSANNQTLIVKHKEKYYVYANIMAESWEDENILELTEARAITDTFEEAYKIADKLDDEYETEYGIWTDELAKDGAKVIIK